MGRSKGRRPDRGEREKPDTGAAGASASPPGEFRTAPVSRHFPVWSCPAVESGLLSRRVQPGDGSVVQVLQLQPSHVLLDREHDRLLQPFLCDRRDDRQDVSAIGEVAAVLE